MTNIHEPITRALQDDMEQKLYDHLDVEHHEPFHQPWFMTCGTVSAPLSNIHRLANWNE